MPHPEYLRTRGVLLHILTRGNDDDNNNSSSSTLSTGLLVGVICASLLAGILFTLGTWYSWRKWTALRQRTGKHSISFLPHSTRPKGLGISLDENAAEAQLAAHTLPDLNFGLPCTDNSNAHHTTPIGQARQGQGRHLSTTSAISSISPLTTTPPEHIYPALEQRGMSTFHLSPRRSTLSPISPPSSPFGTTDTFVSKNVSPQHTLFTPAANSNRLLRNPHTPQKRVKDTGSSSLDRISSNNTESQPTLYTPSIYRAQPPASLVRGNFAVPPSRLQEYSLASLTTDASLAARFVDNRAANSDASYGSGSVSGNGNVHESDRPTARRKHPGPWEYMSAEEAMNGGWRNSIPEGDGGGGGWL